MTDVELIERLPACTVSARPTPVLFVHGMWHGPWCWEEHFAPYFADHGYVCYALALRGHGSTGTNEQGPHGWTSLGCYVVDLADAVERVPKPPVLIGHSLGATVIQKYLESHSAAAAALLAPRPPRGISRATLWFLCRRPLAVLKTVLTLNTRHIVGSERLARDALFSESTPDEEVRKYFRRLQDGSLCAFLDAALLNRPRPERVKGTPMLFLGAARDRILSVSDLRAAARAYGEPSASQFDEQVNVFDTGHDMMLEPGWRGVADRILAWLGERGL